MRPKPAGVGRRMRAMCGPILGVVRRSSAAILAWGSLSTEGPGRRAGASAFRRPQAARGAAMLQDFAERALLFEQCRQRERRSPDDGRLFGKLRMGLVEIHVDAGGAPFADQGRDIRPSIGL